MFKGREMDINILGADIFYDGSPFKKKLEKLGQLNNTISEIKKNTIF